MPNDNAVAKWWRDAVVYQIYPLSFADANGDGKGDIDGIISKIPYLADTLGVDAVWVSPFYKSPMRDWGYDISDHTDVDPVFGDIDSARRLINAVHDRGLKIIIDYVPNHTSDQHAWFIESKSSRESEKRDWYVWRDGRDGGPPNNWVSVFSGPAWTFDEDSAQWYRHTYLVEQPDLNWRSDDLVDAMMDVVRYWLDLGVDGLRVDAAHQMLKDVEERDNPPAPPDYPRPWKDMGEYDEFIHLYDFGQPEVHQAHRRIREVVDSYDRDALTVGEIHIFDLPEWASYYGENLDQLHMPFNFHLMAAEWNAATVRATVESVLWNVPVGAWTNWTLGNHDEIRLATRLPAGQERLAALLLLTLRGTPFIYYGDELGMTEAHISDEDAKDPWGKRLTYLSRDGARTPMQWTPGENAGFSPSNVDTWLPVGADHETANVESLLADDSSILNMYRRLLSLRKSSGALCRGSFLSHPSSTDTLFAFRRESDDETLTVVLNFQQAHTMVDVGRGTVVFSTLDKDRSDSVKNGLELAPGEGVILSHA